MTSVAENRSDVRRQGDATTSAAQSLLMHKYVTVNIRKFSKPRLVRKIEAKKMHYFSILF